MEVSRISNNRAELKMEGCTCRALFAGFFLFLWGGLSIVSGDDSKPCEFTAIYNFGDSNSDTGGTFQKFPPPNAPGRVSDGRVIIDFIAEHLKLPQLSAYPNSQKEVNFQHGANFATAGSTIRKSNETLPGNKKNFLSLDVQIEQFNNLYSEAKNASDRDKLPRQEDFAKALYMFDIGQNDLSWKSTDQVRPAIPDMIDQLASAVQNIYQQGGRTFRIHNTGPFGCLPTFIVRNLNSTPGNIDEHGCVKSLNERAVEFNKQLKERVIKLRSELPEAAITYVDIYAAKYELISNAKNLGFGDPLKACCGIPNQVGCGFNGTTACEEPSKSINWDGIHYTQAANQWVANQILNGSLADPPIPITQSCHRQ